MPVTPKVPIGCTPFKKPPAVCDSNPGTPGEHTQSDGIPPPPQDTQGMCDTKQAM